MAAASRFLKILFVSLLFFALLFFYKPLFHAGLGSLAKLILWQKDLGFAYRAVEWKRNQIVFSDVVVRDRKEDAFQANIEQAAFSFNWKEFPKKIKGGFIFDRPSVAIRNLKPGNGVGDWSNFVVTVREGVLELPGIEKAHFSYEKRTPDQLGHLVLDWPSSRLTLDAFSERDEIQINAELKQIPASLLESFFHLFDSNFLSGWKLKEGIFEGMVHCLFKDKALKKSSGRLEMKQISFDLPRAEWKAADFFCDWDGEMLPKKGLLGDLSPKCPEGRIRLHFNQVGLKTDLGSIQDARGNLTFNSGMGCKWEFEGMGNAQECQFPLSLKGSSFLHSQSVNWMEGQLRFGGDRPGLICINGREEEERRIWKVSLETMRAEQIRLLQAFGSAFCPDFGFDPLDWNLESGVGSAQGEWILSEKGIEDWNLSKIKLEEISLVQGDRWGDRQRDLRIGCQKGEGHFSKNGGKWTFASAFFQIPFSENQLIKGENWEGDCVWDHQIFAPSHLHGWLDAGLGAPVQTSVKISGPWTSWEAESDLAGFLTGRLLVHGSKQEEQWNFTIENGEIEGVDFRGRGSMAPQEFFSLSIDRFEGSIGWLAKIWEGTFDGKIVSLEKGFQVEGNRDHWDWSLEAKVENGSAFFPSLSNCRIENASLELAATPEKISFFKIEGNGFYNQLNLHFACPLLIKTDRDWVFDFRFNHLTGKKDPVWDLMRVAGNLQGQTFLFDEEKSHFLGVPLHFQKCELEGRGAFEACDLQFNLPWNALLAAEPFLHEWGIPSFHQIPLSGSAEIRFRYFREGNSEFSALGKDLQFQGKPLSFDFQAFEKEDGEWKIERCFFSDFSLNGQVKKENGIYRIGKGTGKWKNGLAAEFEGKIASSLLCDLSLSKVRIDLSQIGPLSSRFGLSLDRLEGILEGEGHFTYNGQVESDFDLVSSNLKAGSSLLENKGPIHLYFSSEKGVFFKGLDLQVLKPGFDFPWVDCKVDLLQYDFVRSHWILNHSRIRVPADFFVQLQKHPALFQFFDEKQDLDLLADLDCASDFSTFSCFMKEGFIPCGGEVRHIQDLQLEWNDKECKADFQAFHKGHTVQFGLDVDLGSAISGILQVQEGTVAWGEENPLKIDWEYSPDNNLLIHSIEGAFGGVDASFYEEANQDGNTLLGSVRVDFKALSDFIPSQIAEVFHELKMGSGYELKGRLKLKDKQAYFNGLLLGKQVELFSYQFRTLLGQVDLSPQHVSISDLKISDHAGVMKIDRIWMGCTQENDPWTLLIPQISILEFRPSLLQKPGTEPGPVSPLVIRDLTLKDFKGILDDSKTYTAKGSLNFINSFKRETTVFDLPADVLSRIVGLDLELLIPVCGKVDFELKDRFFRLSELKEAFSQSHRSEFFLEKDPEEEGPYMDLDGNLKILVKMKQFVLFKFTEAFLISIDGNLSDPQFSLQKKRRFFGI